MSSARESKTIAERILEKQEIIKGKLREINEKSILEQDEKQRQEISGAFVAMSNDLFERAAREGALSQPVKGICSGLMMIGIGYAMPVVNVGFIIMGAFQAAMGLFSFGEDDEDFVSAHQQIMQALYEVARMIEHGFNLLLQKQAFISLQLKSLEAKIDRVEKILGTTTKESYLRDYLTLTDRLYKFLHGKGVAPSATEISKDLRDLQSWISPSGHSYKATVTCTMLITDRFDPAYHAGILGNVNFDNLSMLGYMIGLVGQLVPHRLTDAMKVKLPNFSLFFEAAYIYKSVIGRHRPAGSIASIFTEVAQQFKTISDYFSELLKNTALWDSLTAQLQSFARQANQYLAYLEKNNKFSSHDGVISAVLPEGVERNNLIGILDHIEVRRLLMGRLCETLGNPPSLLEKIKALPSKERFLSRTRASLREANKKLCEAGEKRDVQGVRAALHEGADYNLIVRRPSQLPGLNEKDHFISRKQSLEMFDLLLQHASSFNHFEMDKFYPYSSSEGIWMTPINVMIGHGCFEQLILTIAQGDFDISELSSRPQSARPANFSFHFNRFLPDYGHPSMGHVMGRTGDSSNPQFEIQRAILRDINNPEGVLNLKDLRAGYAFYRAVQDDNFSKMDELLKSVKPHIVLWLTAILGDINPFKELQKRKIQIKILGKDLSICYGKFTYYLTQLATLLGRSKEVINLIESFLSASRLALEPVSRKTLVEFSIEQKFFDTALTLWINSYDQGPDDLNRIMTGYEEPLPAITYSEEKQSLTLHCSSLSQNFEFLAKREKNRNATDPEILKLIKEAKYVAATKRVMQILIPQGMSEEKGFALLRDFARYDYNGVLLAMINPQDQLTKTLLEKHLPDRVNDFRKKGIAPDIIELANVISNAIRKLTKDVLLTDKDIITLLETSISTAYSPTLPSELIEYIEQGMWEAARLDIQNLDKATKKKLLPYLEFKYGKQCSEDEAFVDLIASLKKDISSKDFEPECRSAGLPAAFFTSASRGFAVSPSATHQNGYEFKYH